MQCKTYTNVTCLSTKLNYKILIHSKCWCKCVLIGKQYTAQWTLIKNAIHCTNLTMKDVGNEVVMASGKPKPTKYGQWHSMYDSRLCTSQPTHSSASTAKYQHSIYLPTTSCLPTMMSYTDVCPAFTNTIPFQHLNFNADTLHDQSRHNFYVY